MSKVKSITIFRYSAVLPDDVSTVDQSVRFKRSYVEFDGNNNELLNIEFDQEEGEREKYEHTYDEKGRHLKMSHYYEGELAETTDYSYNEKGLLIKEVLSYTDGSSSVTTYEYGEDGLPLKKEVRDSDGELELMETYKHENGLKVEELKFNGDSEMTESYRFKYVKAGDKDRVEESVEWDAHTGAEVRTMNTYSPEGNYLSSSTYNGQGQLIAKHSVVEDDKKRVAEALSEASKEVVLRKFGYDERDNMLSEERYRNGSIIMKLAQDFDGDNRMIMQSISDGQGYFTDLYEYVFSHDGALHSEASQKAEGAS